MKELVMKHSAFVIILILLTACANPTRLPPPPTPAPIQIAIAPELHPWVDRLNECADQQMGISLFLREIPSSAIDWDTSEAAILLGETESRDDFQVERFVLGWERILFIVNTNNPVEELNQNNLVDLYRGQIQSWQDLPSWRGMLSASVQAWSYSPGSALSLPLESILQEQNGPVIQALLAPDVYSMLEAVQANHGAIGYLPESWLRASQLTTEDQPGLQNLRQVLVSPDLSTLLQLPVLAVTKGKPDEKLSAFLLCVQSNLPPEN